MPTTITVFVETGWGYTPNHETIGLEQLSRMMQNYPTPDFAIQVKKGRRVQILLNHSEQQAHTIVDEFIFQRPQVAPHHKFLTMLEKMGQIPLASIRDPQLDGKVGSVSTLDVSYNPGLSIKDVMARQMIEDAIQTKTITPGITTIIEGTSGNTGAGLALVNLALGLHTILIIPDKMSEEKIERLRDLGADVVVTPTAVEPHHPLSYYSIRDYLGTHANTWVPQQYNNQSNTKAHYQVTGPEIWRQTKGGVTKAIITTGTGGTVTGVGRYLKEQNPNIQIIGVDTIGSILYLLKQGYALTEVQHLAHSYTIQGFGEDILPENLDLSVIDHYIRISDASGLLMTQVLPALGYFQGHSSGAAYAALLETIDKNIVTKKDNVVIIFPDVVLPYRFDVMKDTWMTKNKFVFETI